MNFFRKIREWLTGRKIAHAMGKLDDKAFGEKFAKALDETSLAALPESQMERRAHESHKLGCCTVTLMAPGVGGKAELRARGIQLASEVEADRKKSRQNSERAMLGDGSESGVPEWLENQQALDVLIRAGETSSHNARIEKILEGNPKDETADPKKTPA